MSDRNIKAKETLHQKKLRIEQNQLTINQNISMINDLKRKMSNDDARLPIMEEKLRIMNSIELISINPSNSLMANSKWMKTEKQLNILALNQSIDEIISKGVQYQNKIDQLEQQNSEIERENVQLKQTK